MTEAPEIDPFTAGLQAIMAERGLKPAPLSEASGLGVSAIRDLIRKGSSPKLSTASAIATALEMTVDEIVAASGGHSGAPAVDKGADRMLVPIYAVEASAGYGCVIEHEEVVDTLAFPPGYLRRLTQANPRNLAIIAVKGESMVPTLHDDDIVMIDTTKKDLSFDGLFVIRDDGAGLLVKRIGRASQRGYVMMIPDNKAYPSVERKIQDVEVIGRVIWMGKKA